MTDLLALPDNIFTELQRYLNPKDYASLAHTCRRLQQLWKNDLDIYRQVEKNCVFRCPFHPQTCYFRKNLGETWTQAAERLTKTPDKISINPLTRQLSHNYPALPENYLDLYHRLWARSIHNYTTRNYLDIYSFIYEKMTIESNTGDPIMIIYESFIKDFIKYQIREFRTNKVSLKIILSELLRSLTMTRNLFSYFYRTHIRVLESVNTISRTHSIIEIRDNDLPVTLLAQHLNQIEMNEVNDWLRSAN